MLSNEVPNKWSKHFHLSDQVRVNPDKKEDLFWPGKITRPIISGGRSTVHFREWKLSDKIYVKLFNPPQIESGGVSVDRSRVKNRSAFFNDDNESSDGGTEGRERDTIKRLSAGNVTESWFSPYFVLNLSTAHQYHFGTLKGAKSVQKTLQEVCSRWRWVFALQKGNVADRKQVEINQPIDPTYRAQIGLRWTTSFHSKPWVTASNSVTLISARLSTRPSNTTSPEIPSQLSSRTS